MATKAQKRLAGEAKQAANREESRQSGLAAQAKDRQRREAKKQAEAKAAREAEQAEFLRLERIIAAKKMATPLTAMEQLRRKVDESQKINA